MKGLEKRLKKLAREEPSSRDALIQKGRSGSYFPSFDPGVVSTGAVVLV